MEVSKSLCYVEPTERVTRIEPVVWLKMYTFGLSGR